MFAFKNSKDLTKSDIRILEEIASLSAKAQDAEKQIKKTYLFHIGEDKICIWGYNCDGNCEYLTFDGVWQGRYNNQSYDIVCSAENIFEYMKADYLVKNGYVDKVCGNQCTEESKKAHIFGYFQSFLKRTAEMYANNNE